MYPNTFSSFRRSLSMSLFVLLGCVTSAHARSICVDNSADLQAALRDGETQVSPYEIRVVRGISDGDHYTLPALQLDFSQPTRIVGGYSKACASREINATNTVIDFGGARNDASFSASRADGPASITLDGLTLQNGGALKLSAGDWDPLGGTLGALQLSHLRITDFSVDEAIGATPKLPLLLQSHRATTALEHVQIDHLQQADLAATCSIQLGLDGDSAASLQHVTVDLSDAKNLCFSTGQASGNYRVDIDNSIFWSSDGSASGIVSSDEYHVGNRFELNLSNSIYRDNISGVAALRLKNSQAIDPQWMLPSHGNYHLRSESPALRVGSRKFSQATRADIEGNTTLPGVASDLGAIESPQAVQTFVVTSVKDDDPNDTTQLRGAINAANLLSGPSVINFNFPHVPGTTCQYVIGLNSLLPAITSQLTINGYSQPGSAPNNDSQAFNAKLCITILPASGLLPRGFLVAAGSTNASLTLRGLGLGGFGQAVALFGGKNHLIAGNQFGGVLGNFELPGATLNAIAIGTNATGTLVVGGNAAADRNVIISAGNGVNVFGTITSTPAMCQIVNNLVGLAPDGVSKTINTVSMGNQFGISIGGNGCLVAGNRVANNSIRGIWINGGNNNVIQTNIVGIDAAANDAPNGDAILVNGNNNAIGSAASGAITGTALGNLVRYTGSVGITIASGTGNIVRSNRIFDINPFSSSSTLDIDLGNQGADANDLDDGDTGANQLQNFPLVKALIFASTPAPGATNVAVTLSGRLNSQPGSFRLDAYFSSKCNSAKRGGAQVFLDNTSASIVAGNVVVFNMSLVLPNVLPNAAVSLVATDASGNSSEIGTCFPVDRIFQDGVESD